MIFKYLYMYITGVIEISVEGFYIEKFINKCREKNIILWHMETENGTILKTCISMKDSEEFTKIAKEVSCIISVNNEKGLPVFIKKYIKRKIFAITFIVIAIFFFIITRFIWNIEIVGLNKISKEEILSNLGNYGIAIGKSKIGLDLDEIKNKIRMERSDLAWIGINIKGTNAIVEIVENVTKPEIMNKNIKTDIYADKEGIISKIIVRNGTARVNVGDTVSVR